MADAVAVVHAAAVLFMLTGALLALRWPRLLIVHLPVSLGILVVNRSGADCPLTTLELWLRSRAGVEPYSGGFLHHYVFAPLGIDMAAAPVQTAMYAVAVLLSVVGYGLLATRLLHSAGRDGRRLHGRPSHAG